MQLEKIDPIGFQPFQRRVRRADDRVRRKILRNLALTAAASFAVRDEIVADLRRDHDFVALFWKSFGDQFFAQTIAVGVGGVEQA